MVKARAYREVQRDGLVDAQLQGKQAVLAGFVQIRSHPPLHDVIPSGRRDARMQRTGPVHWMQLISGFIFGLAPTNEATTSF